MTIVLIFVFFYILVSMWDVMRVNDLFVKMVDPGAYRRAHTPDPEPAPRLVIPGQTLPPPADLD